MENSVIGDRIEKRFSGLSYLIGNTPQLEIEFTYNNQTKIIYAKAENLNMTGSIKDRMAFHILKRGYDKSLPMINADPSFIRIIFQNLLSNAVKYTQSGGEIELNVALQEQDALITIKDNGYGIPKDEQDKMFVKFFRARNIQQKEQEGTGLGLYIVKSILEQTGGRIWFESAEDKVKAIKEIIG